MLLTYRSFIFVAVIAALEQRHDVINLDCQCQLAELEADLAQTFVATQDACSIGERPAASLARSWLGHGVPLGNGKVTGVCIVRRPFDDRLA